MEPELKSANNSHEMSQHEIETRLLIRNIFDLCREWKQGEYCAWVNPFDRYRQLREKAKSLGYEI